MSADREIYGDDRCDHCGERAEDHHFANFAEGTEIGREFLVCPRNTFRHVPHHDDPDYGEDPAP